MEIAPLQFSSDSYPHIIAAIFVGYEFITKENFTLLALVATSELLEEAIVKY